MMSDAMTGAIFSVGVYGLKNLANSLRSVKSFSCGTAKNITSQNPIDDLTPKLTGSIDDIANNTDDALNSADDILNNADDAAKNSQLKNINDSSTTPTTDSVQGFSSKGYNPQPGERTINGYVRNNANPEVSLTTKSARFNNNNGNVGGVFKRFGSESHGGVSPHVHQPQRNVAPNGNIYGSVGSKTSNGGVTSPSTKDVKQLYQYLNNGKYQ